MLIKLGVDISRLIPQIRKKLTWIDKKHWEILGIEAVITSTYEGNHSAGSIHYGNGAIDLRTWAHKVKETNRFIADCRREFGIHYDIVVKPDHIHIEWDPK